MQFLSHLSLLPKSIYYPFRHAVYLPGHDTPLPSGKNVTCLPALPCNNLATGPPPSSHIITVKSRSEFRSRFVYSRCKSMSKLVFLHEK
jgi:hypothetical protein